MRTVYVEGFYGLGDSFYMRPALRALLDDEDRVNGRSYKVLVRTPWPQVFEDLRNVSPVRPGEEVKGLRTQWRNVRNRHHSWASRPEDPDALIPYRCYTEDLRAGRTIVDSMMEMLRIPNVLRGGASGYLKVPGSWIETSVHESPTSPEGDARPVGVVRFPTVKSEFRDESRCCPTSALERLIELYPDVSWVSLADLEEGREWWYPREPEFRDSVVRLHRGNFTLEGLVGFLSRVDFVLHSPSFLLPMCQSIGVPQFCVFGGSVPPECLIDPRTGPGPVSFAAPRPFCACLSRNHACKKSLDESELEDRFNAFLRANVRAYGSVGR